MEELEISMIDEMLEKAKKAQAEVENYTQEQVDALVKAIGKAIYDNAEMLANEAVTETAESNCSSMVLSER